LAYKYHPIHWAEKAPNKPKKSSYEDKKKLQNNNWVFKNHKKPNNIA